MDIWGLACCLIEIFGGPIPYEDLPQLPQVARRILLDKRPPLVPPWFHARIRPTLEACLHFEPERRPSAGEVQLAIAQLQPRDLEQTGMDRRRTE